MLANIEVTIYRSQSSAMQSSSQKTQKWKIKFPNDNSKYNYELMNWSGSKDTKQQLNLFFNSKEEAINFAEKNNWKFEIIEPHQKRVKLKSYADNFTS
jgi:hypothetical protein